MTSTKILKPLIKPKKISIIFEKSLINFDIIRDFHNILAQIIYNLSENDNGCGSDASGNFLLSPKTFSKILKALDVQSKSGLQSKVEMVLKKFLKFVKKNDCFNLERCFKLFKNQKHFKQYSLPSQFWYMIPALTTPSSMSKLKSNNSVFIVNKFHYKNPKSGETLEEYI